MMHSFNTFRFFILLSLLIGLFEVLCAFHVVYKNYAPCSFKVSLPTEWILKPIEQENSIEYCDYKVLDLDKQEIIRIHSTTKGRFEFSNMKQGYEDALKSTNLKVTYKMQKQNWFIISGINPTNKHIVYWKSIMGNAYISDLIFDYPTSKKKQMDVVLTNISHSFSSN